MVPDSSETLEFLSSETHWSDASVLLDHRDPMDKDPIVEALRRLVEREGGWVAVADAIGANDQSLYQIVRGIKHPKSGNPKGVGPALRKKLSARYPNWLADPAAPTLAGGNADEAPESRVSLAHDLSDAQPIIVPITMSWESLVGDLPNEFKLVMRDDARAPEYPQGSLAIFSTAEGPPRARDAVLVRDQAGHHYFREYRVRTADRWQAAALAAGYDPLDSQADGLVVVAICVGKWGRRG